MGGHTFFCVKSNIPDLEAWANHFLQKKNLLYCTFWYMLVLFGFMALDHCTVINSVRPFLFVHKEQFNIICFFLFLNLNTFWVLRFLFLWTFTNLFLRPKKPTTAFLKFSKIWVLFLIYRFLYSDTECSKYHDFQAIFALAHSKINKIS